MSEDLSIREDDHVLGPREAAVTLIEYGDFQCPYCARAHQALTQLRERHGDRLRLVYRHLPLVEHHPFAELAAETAEAAGAQGKFWEMHDLLFQEQALINPSALPQMGERLQLDVGRLREDGESRRYRDRVRRDADAARSLGATSTPTFFINGERYHGDSDHASLSAAVEQALERAERNRA